MSGNTHAFYFNSDLYPDYEEAIQDLSIQVGQADLEYVDNFRAYMYGDEEGLKAFKEDERSGCCGNFQSYTSVNGKKWIIGCNYGH